MSYFSMRGPNYAIDGDDDADGSELENEEGSSQPGQGGRQGKGRGGNTAAKVGGGALPLLELPGPVVAVDGPAEPLAARLRNADPPVVGRIQDGRLLLDPRTLAEEEIDLVRAALA